MKTIIDDKTGYQFGYSKYTKLITFSKYDLSKPELGIGELTLHAAHLYSVPYQSLNVIPLYTHK